MKDIAVVYHGKCPDGFGGAYAAWKKFGETADYIPAVHGAPAPDLQGREVYMIDFSYPQDVLLAIEKTAKRLVVLDHHMGAREAVESVKEHVFDNDHSGCGIAWEYFHPGTPLPRLLTYIQDNDLWRHALPHGKEVAAYIGTMQFQFESFDSVVSKVDTDEGFAQIIQKGSAFAEYFEHTVSHMLEYAEMVQLDEYTVLAVNSPRLFRSELGHRLASKHAPFAIVWYVSEGKWHFSLRGDGTVDVSEIARRRGGNGHHDAASFRQSLSKPLPFTFLPQA